MTGEVFLWMVAFFAALGGAYMFLMNMSRKDAEKTKKFFDYLGTEEGQKKAEDAVKAFEALRTMNRRSKSGRPIFEDTKPEQVAAKQEQDIDARIELIIKNKKK